MTINSTRYEVSEYDLHPSRRHVDQAVVVGRTADGDVNVRMTAPAAAALVAILHRYDALHHTLLAPQAQADQYDTAMWSDVATDLTAARSGITRAQAEHARDNTVNVPIGLTPDMVSGYVRPKPEKRSLNIVGGDYR